MPNITCPTSYNYIHYVSTKANNHMVICVQMDSDFDFNYLYPMSLSLKCKVTLKFLVRNTQVGFCADDCYSSILPIHFLFFFSSLSFFFSFFFCFASFSLFFSFLSLPFTPFF